MADSSQKFIARNRAPRVQIEYDVELYGAEKKVQLPFVMGVLSDLSGKSHQKPPALEDRKFLEIDADNFDARMRAVAPRVEFSVPNTLTGEGNLAVDISFESMDDFSPAAIARKVEPLRKLLDARTQLSNLMTYMDGKAGAEDLIGKLIADPATLRALTGVDAGDGMDRDAALAALRAMAPSAVQGADDRAVLDALRASAPQQADAPDQTASALAGLAATAPADEAPADTTGAALAGLAATAPADEAPADTTGAALAGLAAAARPDDAPADTTGAALAGLAATAPADEAPSDTTGTALAGLAAHAAPETPPPADGTADALAALARATPQGEPAPDTTAAALSGLAASAGATEVPGPADNSAALDALRGATGEDTPEHDPSADALAGLASAARADQPASDNTAALDALRAATPQTAPESNTTADALDALAASDTGDAPADNSAAALDGLRAAAPETAPEPDSVARALDDLAALAPGDAAPDTSANDALAALAQTNTAAPDEPENDPLAGLDDLLGDATPEPATAGDPLAGLDDLLQPAAVDPAANADASSAAVPNDDPLAGLDDLLGDATPEQDTAAPDDPLAGLDELFAQPETAAPDDPLAGLDDLLEPAATDPAPETGATTAAATDDDPLAGLDELLAQPETAATDDPLAGLDDLLQPAAVDPVPETEASEAAVPEEDPLAGLDDLLGDATPEPETAATDDPLAGLDDLLGDATPEPATATGDPLAGLDELLAQPETAATDDPLAGLDDLLQPAAVDPVPETEASSAAVPDEDPLAGLDDLLADAPANAPDDDPLAGLDDLLAQPDTAAEQDPFAGLDDLLDTPPSEAAPVTLVSAQIPFGTMSLDRPDAAALPRSRFRIAILGDFSGRAASGRLETGPGLAARRAIPFDVDDVEELIESFATKLVLPLGPGGKGIAVDLKELDDLHPDALYDKLDLFSEITGMRQRLKAGSMADAAVAKLREWGAQFGADTLAIRRPSPAASVPSDRKLSDFQSLIGDTEGRLATPAPGADFIAQIVGPYVKAAPDPGAAGMLEATDQALSAAMRLVLHAPEFQAIEAQWRSLDFLARRVETDEKLELVLYDVSAEEIAADLATHEDLAKAGLTGMLATLPMEEDGPGAFSAVMGLYTFEETPPHAELLARVARLAAHIDAPFFTAISPEFLKTRKSDRHPLTATAWDNLRAMPEAKYLGLATPRFLLRHPYGAKTDPVSAFDFEEFTPKEGLKGMLWANPVVAVTVLLAAHFTKNGKAMGLGEIMSLGDIPFHYVTDAHGDQVALPCTERNITTSVMEDIVTRGFMPIVSPRGRDQIRLASFQSVGGGEIIGPWSGVERPAPSKPAPAAPAAATADDDLDALLADLGGFDEPSGDLDAELAALLEGL